MSSSRPEHVETGPSQTGAFRRAVLGKPKQPTQPGVFHRLSLDAALAWVGLGSDGLSSSAYGPEEAFRALGEHRFLALAIALATAATVFVIAAGYSRIIERFPSGGGGYLVASHLLGPFVGVVSGSALLVDYVLTVTISISSGGDAVFSFLPLGWAPFKLAVEVAVVMLLLVMNLRGVKESVVSLVPIFVAFLVTHVILIGGAVLGSLGRLPEVAADLTAQYHHDIGVLGKWGLLLLFFRAYSMGAGTYTGIEAVSNGMTIMKEPRVETAKRTMRYMAISLATTAAGLVAAYLLMGIQAQPGRTFNAVLAEAFAGHWQLGGLAVGSWFVVLTLFSEAALLFVAAQAGFIDGPRVMANMATDSWLPHQFASLSEQLTMHNGIFLIGGSALLLMLATRGAVSVLIVLYSINVFLTFSLSNLGMLREEIRLWRARQGSLKGILVHGVGFTVCAGILAIVVVEKFGSGGWATLVITASVVLLAYLVHRHYQGIRSRVRDLDAIVAGLPAAGEQVAKAVDPKQPTAVMLVGGYSGLGIHTLLSVLKTFPNLFENVVFFSVAVVDSASFKGADEVERLLEASRESLARYEELARRLGFATASRYAVGIDVVEAAEQACEQIAHEFPRAVFFSGQLIFERPRWWERFLHNQTAFAIQRRLQFKGLSMVILPVRVLESAA